MNLGDLLVCNFKHLDSLFIGKIWISCCNHNILRLHPWCILFIIACIHDEMLVVVGVNYLAEPDNFVKHLRSHNRISFQIHVIFQINSQKHSVCAKLKVKLLQDIHLFIQLSVKCIKFSIRANLIWLCRSSQLNTWRTLRNFRRDYSDFELDTLRFISFCDIVIIKNYKPIP